MDGDHLNRPRAQFYISRTTCRLGSDATNPARSTNQSSCPTWSVTSHHATQFERVAAIAAPRSWSARRPTARRAWQPLDTRGSPGPSMDFETSRRCPATTARTSLPLTARSTGHRRGLRLGRCRCMLALLSSSNASARRRERSLEQLEGTWRDNNNGPSRALDRHLETVLRNSACTCTRTSGYPRHGHVRSSTTVQPDRPGAAPGACSASCLRRCVRSGTRPGTGAYRFARCSPIACSVHRRRACKSRRVVLQRQLSRVR